MHKFIIKSRELRRARPELVAPRCTQQAWAKFVEEDHGLSGPELSSATATCGAFARRVFPFLVFNRAFIFFKESAAYILSRHCRW